MAEDSTSKHPPKETATAEQTGQSGESATQAVSDVGVHLAEFREHLVHLVQVKTDVLRAKLFRAGTALVLTLAALVIVVSFLATVVVLLITGLAGGVCELVGNHPWIGNTVTAVMLLTISAFATHGRWKKLKSARLRALVGKYEQRDKRRRARFGQAP